MKTVETLRHERTSEDGRPALPRPIVAWLSSKVLSRHLDRMALVYLRQSSPRQVAENRESTEMQYRLQDRAVGLGWPQSRVLLIDDDLGQSGQSIAGRPGFQRVLAEVGLDHVGIILGIEMSRLARSCRDWHQLLELCAVFGTLLGDADGVYDPCDYNDRLLLGLKGTMSEAELHVLRGRLEAGQKNKARRGQLFTHAPIGYMRLPDGELALEPDEQARGVVQLIFAKFAELGSACAVLRYLRERQIRVGMRPHRRAEQGQLVWRRPNSATLQGMLHHPIYAGAYVYGRRTSDPRKRIPGRRGTGRAWAAPEDWQVLLKDQLPAYITWEQYETNQRRLRDNSSKFGRGAPRNGCAVLGGLVVCGRCGRRMNVCYPDRSNARFVCDGARNHWGEPQCQALAARPVEALVARQLLIALEPASLELSLAAADQIESERQRLEGHQRQGVERARYEAERAWRQYTAVEPEHRLVARDLEQRWEAALQQQRSAEEALDRFRREQPVRLNEAERQRICELAIDMPALWHAETTKPSDRQAIARQLIEKVTVTVVDGSELVDVTIHWTGGFESRHDIRRAVSSYQRLHDGQRVLARVTELKHQGLPHAEVAQRLNAEGFHGPHGGAFTEPMVSFVWRRAQGTRRAAISTARDHDPASTANDHWHVRELSKRLDVPATTLNTWRRRGWVHARHHTGSDGAYWLYWADAIELQRLERLRQHPRVGLLPVPVALTVPAAQPPWATEADNNKTR